MRLLRRLLGAWHWSPIRVAWSLPLVAFGTWGLVNALQLDAGLGAFFVLACGLSGLLGPDWGARGWRALATRAGLQFFPRDLTHGRSIAGTQVDQRVTLIEDSLKRNRALLVVSERIPKGFTVHSRSLAARMVAGIAGHVVETGDPHLDAAAIVRGDAAAAIAALRKDGRAELLRLLRDRPDVEIVNGAVRLPLKPVPDADTLSMVVDRARRVATALSCGESDDEMAASLLHSVKSNEPVEPRRHALEALAARFPARDETALARKAARQSGDDRLALVAAEGLGEASLRDFLHEKRKTEYRLKAVKALWKSGDDAKRLEWIAAALDGPLPASILRTDGAGALEAQLLFDDLDDGGLAEPALIACLKHGDRDARELAARALARVGSAAALEPLKKLASVSEEKDGRAAAEAARRLGAGREGELSLGEPEAQGDLSIAGESRGELSIAAKQRFDTLRRKS